MRTFLILVLKSNSTISHALTYENKSHQGTLASWYSTTQPCAKTKSIIIPFKEENNYQRLFSVVRGEMGITIYKITQINNSYKHVVAYP